MGITTQRPGFVVITFSAASGCPGCSASAGAVRPHHHGGGRHGCGGAVEVFSVRGEGTAVTLRLSG